MLLKLYYLIEITENKLQRRLGLARFIKLCNNLGARYGSVLVVNVLAFNSADPSLNPLVHLSKLYTTAVNIRFAAISKFTGTAKNLFRF